VILERPQARITSQRSSIVNQSLITNRKSSMSIRRLAPLIIVALCVSASVSAQFRRGFFGVRVATPGDFDGRFHFCRLVYQPSPTGAGGSWTTDYPRGDINLSIRLSELTKTPVSFKAGQPNHLLVRPTDDLLFQCPFVLMSAPGSARFNEKEASRLREYVLKGGFLWADDFWGSYQWQQWESEIRKVLPAREYPIVDLPLTHPMMQTQFAVKAVPQIPNIGYYMRSGGGTSEQGQDSAIAHARIISDRDGRAMVLMTHNTDLGDSWEREGDDPGYFYAFGAPGYAFGINVVLYSLTH
jgi:hypothetical protein